MFEIIKTERDLLAIRASGKIRHGDYEYITPKFEAIIAEHHQIRLLTLIDDFDGMEAKAVWDDLKLGLKHRKHIRRCAIVSEKKWIKYSTKFYNVLFKGEFKCFLPAEYENAMQWVEE